MSKKAKKATVSEELGTVCAYDFEGTKEHLINMINELFAYYEPKVVFGSHLTIRRQPCRYEDEYEYRMVLVRPETDKEQIDRIVKEAARVSLQEDRDRQEFERLSKKFSK